MCYELIGIYSSFRVFRVLDNIRHAPFRGTFINRPELAATSHFSTVRMTCNSEELATRLVNLNPQMKEMQRRLAIATARSNDKP